jgi:predicted amidohydrolase YtcJ
VTRRAKSDGTPFYPGQAMTREEALRSYTWNNAYAIFAEKDLGSLAVGKRADVTVFSKDILSVPEQEILDAKVMYTVVGGRVVY